MAIISVYIDDETYEKMKRHPEIKWSRVCREAIRAYLIKLEEVKQIRI